MSGAAALNSLALARGLSGPSEFPSIGIPVLSRRLNPCENTLTAAIFSHLLHLPADLFWQIVRSACYGTEGLPAYVGEPEVHPWPKWSARGTGNSGYIEPDLFLRFASIDLIIEAKRWDERMQSPAQWQAQLTAYCNEYGQDRKEVRMIALGGIHVEQSDAIESLWTSEDGRESHHFACPVIMCRWQGILYQCKRRRREIGQQAFHTAQTAAEMRILDDIVDMFSCHGFSTGRWYEDLSFERHRLAPSLHGHLARLRAGRISRTP